jgi:hypothetical protein
LLILAGQRFAEPDLPGFHEISAPSSCESTKLKVALILKVQSAFLSTPTFFVQNCAGPERGYTDPRRTFDFLIGLQRFGETMAVLFLWPQNLLQMIF